jgi:hypothetical protein
MYACVKSVPNFDTSGEFEVAAIQKKSSPFKLEKVEEGIQLSMILPVREPNPENILSHDQVISRCMDILGAFSQRIIASLERRQEACKAKLFKNLGTAFTDPNGIQIGYMEDKRLCTFNMPSYGAMSDCIKALRFSMFRSILERPDCIDQIIKALLNDTEQNHEDAGGFKYSQLVSMLCEIHMYHA